MDDKLKEAFDGLTPPGELKEKTRRAVNAHALPARKPPLRRRITAAVVAAVLMVAVIVPVAGYFGFNSTGTEPNGLVTFSTLAEVKDYVSARKSTNDHWISYPGIVNDDALSSAESNSADGSSGTEHSTTNNQVDGVSESDVVHTDGKFIYTLSYYSLSIVDIRDGAFKSAAEVVYDDFSPSEMFLIESENKSENKLVVIGSYYSYTEFYNYGGKEAVMDFCYWRSNALAVKVYDIPALLGGGAEPVRELRFENCYASGSRMIDGKMYLVMNSYAYYNATDIWLPEYYDSKSGGGALEASDIFATPDNGRSYNFTVIAGVDLKNGGDADVKAYFGSTGTLYASKNAFYITYARYEKITFFGYYQYESIGLGVMRFEINGIGLDYKGMGKVAGRVVNQFAMDEYTYADGGTYFRIATTAYDNSDSYITVFDSGMKQVGRLKGLGEQNERIYSVRFSGTEAVVVTYYQTDPLYVIDLTSPAAPRIKSALKIPGVSDYLHFLKIKDGYVFAVGRNESLGGIKVSLYDISGEVTVPKREYEVNSGSGYSYSEATYNHKAIMYFMPPAGDKEIFALPVNVSGYESDGYYSTYYNISNLYYYSIGADGEMTQTVIGYHAEENISAGKSYGGVYYSYYTDSIRRSVIAGDYIYLIGYSGVERYALSNLPSSQSARGDIINTAAEYWNYY